MEIVKITETIHKSLNSKLVQLLVETELEGVYIEYKLKDRLEERNLSLRDFAKLSGLRLATISDICNGTKQSINIHHVIIIMVTLRITDFSEIVNLKFPEETEKEYLEQRRDWVLTGRLPEPTRRIAELMQTE